MKPIEIVFLGRSLMIAKGPHHMQEPLTNPLCSETCNWSGWQGLILARILSSSLADWSLNMDEVTYQSVAEAMVTITDISYVRST